MKNKKTGADGWTNNIWNTYNFRMCGVGRKNKVLEIVKHVKNCFVWSWQRIVRGYADCDVGKCTHFCKD